MRVLDICAGTGSIKKAFGKRGHTVIELDTVGWHDIHRDVRNWKPSGYYDFIWASPPCTDYSLAKGEKYTEKCIDHSILLACLYCIEVLNPQFWIIENPRGFMRKYLGKPLATYNYGDFGHEFKKPTDFWGNFPNISKHITKPKKYGYIKNASGEHNAKSRYPVPQKLLEALCIEIEKQL